jgi:hypothetical protein
MKDYREVIIRPDIRLPPLDTNRPGMDYTFLGFLKQWVVDAPGMRKDENLEHLFEWEEAITSMCDKTYEAMTLLEPQPPKPPEDLSKITAKEAYAYNDALAAHREERKPFDKALAELRVGQKLYISDDAFMAGKQACKSALDEALTPGPTGHQKLNAALGPKVLRHYHAMSMSRKLNEKELPESTTKANGLQDTVS